jgi:hypothetical protein
VLVCLLAYSIRGRIHALRAAAAAWSRLIQPALSRAGGPEIFRMTLHLETRIQTNFIMLSHQIAYGSGRRNAYVC